MYFEMKILYMIVQYYISSYNQEGNVYIISCQCGHLMLNDMVAMQCNYAPTYIYNYIIIIVIDVKDSASYSYMHDMLIPRL